MLLENPLGLHLHQKGTENRKQWVIHRESPAACLAFKFPAKVCVRVCVQSCESLSVCHTSCVFRKYWDFCSFHCYLCQFPVSVSYLCQFQVEQPFWKKLSHTVGTISHIFFRILKFNQQIPCRWCTQLSINFNK